MLFISELIFVLILWKNQYAPIQSITSTRRIEWQSTIRMQIFRILIILYVRTYILDESEIMSKIKIYR